MASIDVDMNQPGPSTGTKRKGENIIVDPDTKVEIPDPKRPRVLLDEDKKVRCLKSLVKAYDEIIARIANIRSPHSKKTAGSLEAYQKELSSMRDEVILASQITSIVFTAHNVHRQHIRGVSTNMQNKVQSTEYNVHYRGSDYSLKREDVHKLWVDILKENELEYKNFAADDDNNWYGTIGPYIDMFAAFKLRIDELRLGHSMMPITKKDGTHTSFQVSKYGLTGAHHVLLEGSSFPPERRSSIVQSLGPMTAFLCMVRTERKWGQGNDDVVFGE